MRFSKEQLLSIYLNRVYLGSGTYMVCKRQKSILIKRSRNLIYMNVRNSKFIESTVKV